MRVDGPLPLPENQQAQKVGRSGSSTGKDQLESVKSNQDKAHLSVDTARIEQLKTELARLPEIRQDRVEALRKAIGDGSYQVADQQLADAMQAELAPSKPQPT